MPEKNDAPKAREAGARTKFSEEDLNGLLNNAKDIHQIPPDNVANTWRAWAQSYDVSIESDKL